MLDKAKLFTLFRTSDMLGPKLSPDEVEGLDAILTYALAHPKMSASRLAYMFATAYHETAGTMQPIREYGSNAYLTTMYDVKGKNPARAIRYGNKKPGDGIKYCGRGFVQLTWFLNYQSAGNFIGIDLVNNPDRAMEIDVAATIMIEGMMHGWFTGASVISLPATRQATLKEFEAARKIINGTDKANRIANYALKFQKYLVEAGMN